MTEKKHKNYFQEILFLAFPVVMGLAARTILGIVDAVMVGRLGAAPLAAVGVGGHIATLTVYSFGSFNVGLQALVARRFGEKNFTKCGEIVNHTMFFILFLGLVGSVAGYFFGPLIISLLTDDIEVINLGKGYVSIRMLEFFAFAIIGMFRGYFDGLGHTKIFMKAMIWMNGLNVVFNYVLIFGHFGFPRLEVTGAAIGSTVSTFIGAAIILYYTFLPAYRTKYDLYKYFKPDISLIKKLYKLNLPQMMQTFLVYSGFLVFFKILGTIGTVALAAGIVAIAIMGLSYMPGYGIGTAAGTLLGQSLGAKRTDLAEKYGWEAMKLGVMFMGGMGVLFLLVPGLIMKIFTNDPEIIREGIIALRIVGAFQAFDACGLILGACVQCAGMTRYVFIVEVSINWLIFLPLSYLFGITMGFQTIGAWSPLAVYMVLYGAIMIWTFKRGKWKKVII